MTDLLTKLAALTQPDKHGLLPCPICGGKAAPDYKATFGYAFIFKCLLGHVTVTANSEDRSKQFWNNRPREAALIALVQEAAAEIERYREVLSKSIVPVDEDQCNWLIFYDDHDRRPEIFQNEQIALHVYEQRQISWNCYLFKQLTKANGKPLNPQESAT